MENNTTTRIMIAMSGGVDSSVAACLCVEQGYDCAGVTMKLICGEQESTCCSLDDIEDARSVCRRLHIPYHVYNFTDSFEEQVIARLVEDEGLSGADFAVIGDGKVEIRLGREAGARTVSA